MSHLTLEQEIKAQTLSNKANAGHQIAQRIVPNTVKEIMSPDGHTTEKLKCLCLKTSCDGWRKEDYTKCPFGHPKPKGYQYGHCLNIMFCQKCTNRCPFAEYHPDTTALPFEKQEITQMFNGAKQRCVIQVFDFGFQGKFYRNINKYFGENGFVRNSPMKKKPIVVQDKVITTSMPKLTKPPKAKVITSVSPKTALNIHGVKPRQSLTIGSPNVSYIDEDQDNEEHEVEMVSQDDRSVALEYSDQEVEGPNEQINIYSSDEENKHQPIAADYKNLRMNCQSLADANEEIEHKLFSKLDQYIAHFDSRQSDLLGLYERLNRNIQDTVDTFKLIAAEAKQVEEIRKILQQVKQQAQDSLGNLTAIQLQMADNLEALELASNEKPTM